MQYGYSATKKMSWYVPPHVVGGTLIPLVRIRETSPKMRPLAQPHLPFVAEVVAFGAEPGQRYVPGRVWLASTLTRVCTLSFLDFANYSNDTNDSSYSNSTQLCCCIPSCDFVPVLYSTMILLGSTLLIPGSLKSALVLGCWR